jgi:4-hydroxythreonine-4-phosphate dehydrogenase
MSDSTALPLALTLGEPAGIGPDLTIQLWHRRVELRLPAFYLIADPEFIKRRARLLGLEVAVSVAKPAQAAEMFGHALPISALDSPVTATPGRPWPYRILGQARQRIDRQSRYPSHDALVA